MSVDCHTGPVETLSARKFVRSCACAVTYMASLPSRGDLKPPRGTKTVAAPLLTQQLQREVLLSWQLSMPSWLPLFLLTMLIFEDKTLLLRKEMRKVSWYVPLAEKSAQRGRNLHDFWKRKVTGRWTEREPMAAACSHEPLRTREHYCPSSPLCTGPRIYWAMSESLTLKTHAGRKQGGWPSAILGCFRLYALSAGFRPPPLLPCQVKV